MTSFSAKQRNKTEVKPEHVPCHRFLKLRYYPAVNNLDKPGVLGPSYKLTAIREAMSLEEMLANNSKMLGEVLGVMKHLQSLQERSFEAHLRLVETVERITLKQDERIDRPGGNGRTD